jgi:myo-inositol 2-dehydrogenase / D-chiro-inositol 1-dehydrogenase
VPAPVRIALVGLGDIAVRAHLPALLRNERAELAALVEVDPARLTVASALVPGVRATGSVEAVLEDPAIDAVILATPAWVTPGLVRAALEAGKYVLAEKPLAPTLAEQLELRSAPGVTERLQVGLTYRHHPAVDRLRELVASNALGRPLYIQASVCDERADPVGEPEHYARRLRALEHAIPVVLDGIHACDRLNLLFGEAPVELSAWAVKSSPDYASPNVNGAALTYADGTIVRLEVIWLYPVLPPAQFVVTGPRGRAVLDPPTFELHIEIDGVTEVVAPPGDKTESCFALQLERFLAACNDGTAPVPGLEDALAASELCERIADACLQRDR